MWTIHVMTHGHDSLMAWHEVDDDGIPKKYYFIQQFSKGRILQDP
jgi:hypothetical protein